MKPDPAGRSPDRGEDQLPGCPPHFLSAEGTTVVFGETARPDADSAGVPRRSIREQLFSFPVVLAAALVDLRYRTSRNQRACTASMSSAAGTWLLIAAALAGMLSIQSISIDT